MWDPRWVFQILHFRDSELESLQHTKRWHSLCSLWTSLFSMWKHFLFYVASLPPLDAWQEYFIACVLPSERKNWSVREPVTGLLSNIRNPREKSSILHILTKWKYLYAKSPHQISLNSFSLSNQLCQRAKTTFSVTKQFSI